MKKNRPALRVVYDKSTDEGRAKQGKRAKTAEKPAKAESPPPTPRHVKGNIAPPEPVSAEAEKLRVADPLQRYLAEIRRYAILDRETEQVLTRQYVQTADPRIAVRLITSNLRLVVKIALEYQSPWVSLLDIIQEGNLGLLQAVKKYDPERNIRLSSYAQWWIRAYILKFLMDNHRLVKVGTTQAQRKLFYNLQRERERLERQGFRPTPRLLAKALSVRVKDVIEMETRLSGKEVSLDAPLIEGERDRLIDLLPSDRADVDDLLAKREVTSRLLRKLDEFAATLTGRDLEIWTRRLLAENPVTLQALGNLFGVSRERARQLEARVLRRLRTFLGDEKHLLDNVSFPLFQ